MGGFPALMIKPPESPIQQLAGVEQLKGAVQQQQMGEIQLQNARLEQQSNQTMMRAFQQSGGDYNQMYAIARDSGSVLPGDLMKLQSGVIAMQTAMATKTEKDLTNLGRFHDLTANEVEAFKALPAAQRTPDAIKAAAGRLANEGVDISKVMPDLQSLAQDPSDANIRSVEIKLKGEQWLLSNEKVQRENLSAATPADAAAQRAATLRETQAKGDLAAAEAAEKGSPLTRMEHDPSQLAGDKLPSAIGYLQNKIADPNTETKDVARATSLLAQAHIAQSTQLAMDRMKKAAETAVTQGSPTAAAQLLVAGDATLSQLKARGSTPEFIASTLQEASRISGGKFNAQKSEADFDVAKSQANVTFFGSAKSLIDKGGTLDQLADVGKDIPQGKIPVFNSVADAIKASTGSGPIAKYAAVALGVADDYAKVMGGGQGSDTARTQALKLISEKESPEQRAASIEGVRNAVASQTNSRIGNNPILRRMYGDGVQSDSAGNVKHGPPAGMTHKVMGPDGKLHYTNATGTVDGGLVE